MLGALRGFEGSFHSSRRRIQTGFLGAMLFGVLVSVAACGKQSLPPLPEAATDAETTAEADTAKPKDEPKVDPAEEVVLATVNGRKITIKDYNDRLKKLSSFERARYREQDGHKEFLKMLVQRELLIQEAKRLGLENDPKVKERVAEILKDVTENVMIDEVVQREVFDKIVISDEEAKQYYDENIDEFTQKEQVRLRHILLKTEEDAQEVLDALAEGASFEDLARERSEDPGTAPDGGDLGVWPIDAVWPEIREALADMEVGETSGIVKSDLGYHIVRLEAREPQVTKEFYEVRDEIKRKLAAQRKRDAYEEWMKRLEDSADIEIDESVFTQ